MDDRRPEPEVVGHLGDRDGTVRARVAQQQVAQRIRDGLKEDPGQADRKRDAEGIAKPGRVIGERESLDPGEADRNDPAGGDQLLDVGRQVGSHLGNDPLRQLGLGQRAKDPDKVGDLVRIAGLALRGEALQLSNRLGERLRVE